MRFLVVFAIALVQCVAWAQCEWYPYGRGLFSSSEEDKKVEVPSLNPSIVSQKVLEKARLYPIGPFGRGLFSSSEEDKKVQVHSSNPLEAAQKVIQKGRTNLGNLYRKRRQVTKYAPRLDDSIFDQSLRGQGATYQGEYFVRYTPARPVPPAAVRAEDLVIAVKDLPAEGEKFEVKNPIIRSQGEGEELELKNPIIRSQGEKEGLELKNPIIRSQGDKETILQIEPVSLEEHGSFEKEKGEEKQERLEEIPWVTSANRVRKLEDMFVDTNLQRARRDAAITEFAKPVGGQGLIVTPGTTVTFEKLEPKGRIEQLTVHEGPVGGKQSVEQEHKEKPVEEKAHGFFI